MGEPGFPDAFDPHRHPTFDGAPDPQMSEPSRALMAAIRKDPEVLAALRDLRTTEYHWIGDRGEGLEPINGGHIPEFDQVKGDCEYVIALTPKPDSPISQVRSIRILDARGQIVWSKDKVLDANA